MKFNPNCSKETLLVWLNNSFNDQDDQFGTRIGINSPSDIFIDGNLNSKQIKMIHEWMVAHENN